MSSPARTGWVMAAAALLLISGCGGESNHPDAAGGNEAGAHAPTPDLAPPSDAPASEPAPAAPDAAVDAGAADGPGAGGPMDAATDGSGPGGPVDAAPDVPGAASYQIRVPLTQLPADGYSLLPLLIQGPINAEDVVLSVSNQMTGLVKPRVFKLGGPDPQSYFVPCSSASSPGCLGTTRVRLERAATPGVIVAESPELTIANLDAVGTPAMCLIGSGNALFLDGSGYIFTGTMLIDQGTFDGSKSARPSIQLTVSPTDPKQGQVWRLIFSKRGEDLKVGVYRQAERDPFASPGHPGLEITTDSRGCNSIAGAFQVHQISFAGNQLVEVLISYEQNCDGSSLLRGCLHYVSP